MTDTTNQVIFSDSDKDKTIGPLIGSQGAVYPIIEINGFRIGEDIIKVFELRNEKRLPEIVLTFKDSSGLFGSKPLPKDGDLVNVYIRSMNVNLKPVRADFLIYRVISDKSKDSSGNNSNFTIYGKMYIPTINASHNLSYGQMTSLEVFMEIANSLGLGLVTNVVIEDMKDKMNWLNPNATVLEFMEFVCEHAYSTDSTFFDFWIDWYYCINFVNLDTMFAIAEKEEVPAGIDYLVGTGDYNKDGKINYVLSPNILTNFPSMNGSGNFVTNQQKINRSGSIVEKEGYVKNLIMFDYTSGTFVNFDFQTTVTETNDPKIPLKGRPHEDTYKEERKHTWAGWNYQGEDNNTHSFYKEASYQNRINNTNTKKMELICDLDKVNLNFYRGQRVPVLLFVVDDPVKVRQTAWEKDGIPNSSGLSVDRSLTGNYIIGRINIIFKNSIANMRKIGNNLSMYQEICLIRREWTHPKFEEKK